jgi:hypothetical protein
MQFTWHLLQLRVRARAHEDLANARDSLPCIAVTVAAAATAAAAARAIANDELIIIRFAERFCHSFRLLPAAPAPCPNRIPAPLLRKGEAVVDLGNFQQN